MERYGGGDVHAPHVAERVVVRGKWRPGAKNDRIDAHGWAEKRRTGQIRKVAFKDAQRFRALRERKREAEAARVQESHGHPIARRRETATGFGLVRGTELLPIVVTPVRFRTQRQFWTSCGFGGVLRSSSDWVQEGRGWRRAPGVQSRV